MGDQNDATHLLTKYVYIDTEAFRKQQFDWEGRALARLVQFAKHGHVRVLITEVTRAEVAARLREMLSEAAAASRKHAVILGQVGAAEAHARLVDETAAMAMLETGFKKFLSDAGAIDVPISADLNALLSDYFARRPPFSEKKKAEFPDAVVIASLLNWCNKNRTTAYVVSGDPDLKACCSSSGPLHYSVSITEIISRATVSEKLHQSLEKALQESDLLKESLAEKIERRKVEASGHTYSHRYRDEVTIVSGRVDSVDDVSVHYVNVLEQENHRFTCEIEFEAELGLDLEIEFEEERRWLDEHAPRLTRESVSESVVNLFGAEVIVNFDPGSPEEMEFDSIDVYDDEVKVKPEQLERRRRYR